ncbi:hypothetical protein N2152v2_003425 [Parachlorella kessleri]
MRVHLLLSLIAAVALTGDCALNGTETTCDICGPRAPCHYRVKKGDYLALIAHKFGMKVRDLLAMNERILHKDYIRAGWNLNVTCTQPMAATKGKDLQDLLCHREDQSLLLLAMHSIGLQVLVPETIGNATVFAPTNEALRIVLAGMRVSFDQLLQDEELLQEVLSYHIVPGQTLKAANLVEGLVLPTLLSEQNLTVVEADNATYLETSSGQSVRIIRKNLLAGRVTVHVVDEVLLPSEPFGIPCQYTIKQGDSLWQIAETYGKSLTSLIDANPELPDPYAILPGTVIALPCA